MYQTMNKTTQHHVQCLLFGRFPTPFFPSSFWLKAQPLPAPFALAEPPWAGSKLGAPKRDGWINPLEWCVYRGPYKNEPDLTCLTLIHVGKRFLELSCFVRNGRPHKDLPAKTVRAQEEFWLEMCKTTWHYTQEPQSELTPGNTWNPEMSRNTFPLSPPVRPPPKTLLLFLKKFNGRIQGWKWTIWTTQIRAANTWKWKVPRCHAVNAGTVNDGREARETDQKCRTARQLGTERRRNCHQANSRRKRKRTGFYGEEGRTEALMDSLTADSCRLKGIIERERFEEQPGALRQEGLLSTNEGIHKEG